MSRVSSKQIEGIIVIVVIAVLGVWYSYQAFRTRTGTATVVADVSTSALQSPSLQQAADVARNEQSRYGVPVPPPSADELGKDQLF